MYPYDCDLRYCRVYATLSFMEIQPKEVEIYVTPEGKQPFSEWLSSLRDQKGKDQIRARIARLRLGQLGDAKPVGERVSELRMDVGPGYRLYFGQKGQTFILLLCGGADCLTHLLKPLILFSFSDFKFLKN